MEKYLKAVSEMYSQFKQREPHPMEKYIGRLAMCYGKKVEVVGYRTDKDSTVKLIVCVPRYWGRAYLGPQDVIFKKCEGYLYVGIHSLIN